MQSILLAAIAVMLAGCASAYSEPVADATVLIAESSGGCAQLGPNCVSIVVHGDGEVTAFRITATGSELVDTAVIDRELVIALDRELAATDQDELLASLPPGECRGCFDGIDTTMSFPIYPLPVVTPTFSSVDVKLDRSEPVFAAAWAVYEAAQAVIEVPVISR